MRNATHEEDFVRAIYYLTNSSLEYEAYNWLLGKNLSSNTLRKLGITANIDNSELAKVSLHFFATFFAQAHQPLFIYIDQIEYLLLNTSTEKKSANIGALQSLAEIFAQKNLFLCLSGTTEAWKTLPENFFARILSIEISNLSIDESLNLMTTYLSSSNEPNSYKSKEDIYPYTKASVSKILRLSDGNIRQFLRIAHEAFEEAVPHHERIQVSTIKKVAQVHNIFFDSQIVLKKDSDGTPLFIFYGGVTAVTISISIILIPGLLSLITQLTIKFFSYPWVWIFLATLGTIIFNFAAFDKKNRLAIYVGITFAAILLLVLTYSLLNSPRLFWLISNFFLLITKFKISSLTPSLILKIVGISCIVLYFLLEVVYPLVLILTDKTEKIVERISLILGAIILVLVVNYLELIINFLIQPLILGIIGISISLSWLFFGALNTWNRRKMQKKKITKIEEFQKNTELNFMISGEQNELIKSSRLNDLVINPIKYGAPFLISIGIIYAFNIFSSNITLILAIVGGLLSPFLFLRIPYIEQKTNN